MKKALLGSTALVAGGLFAGAATAADIIPAPIPEPIEEGFTLTVSGDATAAFSFRNTDECDDDDANSFSGAAILAAAGTGAGNTNGITGTSTASVNTLFVATAAGTHSVYTISSGTSFNAGSNHLSACTADVNALAGLGTADAAGQFGHDDQSAHVQWSSEIRFTAEQTLANGLTITARVELEGQTTGDQIDEHWISFAGHFGRIVIGADDSAYDDLKVTAPGVGGPIATLDGPSANVLIETNTQTGFNANPGGDSNKIKYFTPRFAGIQVGVSYAPDGSTLTGGSSQSQGQNHVLDSIAGYINEWSIGANFEHSMGEYTISVGGGYTEAEAGTQIDTFAECQALAGVATAATAFGALTGDFNCGDRTHWGIGGQLSSSYFTVGAWYSNGDFDLGKEEEVWAVSGIITQGDWEYGLGYAEYTDEHRLGGFEDERTQWAFGIGNNLAPGVSIGAFVFYAEEEAAYRSALAANGANIDTDVEGWTVGIATGLSF